MNRYLPLRYTLPVMLVLVMLVTELFSYGYYRLVFEERMTDYAAHEAEEFERVRDYIEYFLSQGEELKVKKYIDRLATDEDIKVIRVVDAENNVLLSTVNESLGEKYIQPHVYQSFGTAGISIIQLEESLFSYYPIELPAYPVGSGRIYVEMDLGREMEELSSHLIMSPIIDGVSLIFFMALLWWYVEKRVTGRVNQLQRFASCVGEGSFDTRIDVGRGDEIGGLAQSLGSMVERLQSQQDHLVALQRAMDEHAIVSVFNFDGSISYVNPRACNISGHQAHEVLGQQYDVGEIFHQGIVKTSDAWELIRQGDVWQGVVQKTSKQGLPYWLQSTIVPIIDESGQPKKYISVSTDVTQREHLRAGMEQLASTLGDSLDSIGGAVCVALGCRWAGFGRLINDGEQVEVLGFWADGAAGKLFTYDLKDTPCSEVCANEEPLIIPADVAQLYPKDQILVDINAESYRGEPLVDGDDVVGVFFVIDDKACQEDEAERALLKMAAKRAVLEIRRREYEAALEASKLQLIKAQRMAKLGSWSFDHVDNTLVWSEETYRIFEVDAEKDTITFDRFLSFLPPDDLVRVKQRFEFSVKNHHQYSIEHKIVMPDGRMKWIVEAGETEYDSQGIPLRTIGYAHDVSAGKQLERERELLTDGAIVAAESHSFEEAMAHSLELVCKYAGWPVGHVYVHDEVKNCLKSLGVWYLEDAEKNEDFKRVTENASFAMGEGLPGRVWVSSRPELISNITTDSNFPRASRCKDLSLRGAIGLPVMVSGKVEAVMEFFHYEPFESSPEFEKILILFAEQIGRVVERHLSNEQVKKSEERFDLAVRAANDGLWDWDVKSGHLFCAQRWYEMTGYSENAPYLRHDAMLSLIHPADRQRYQIEIEKKFQSRVSSFEFEYRLQHADGHWLDILVRAVIVRDEDGKAVRVVGTSSDISARKKSEKSLLDSQGQLRGERDFVDAVLREAASVIVVMDRDGRVVRFNRHAENITGYKFDEVNGTQVCEIFLPEESKDDFRQIFYGLLDGGEAARFESEWLMKDDGRRLFDWRATVLQDEKGAASYVVAQGVDITEQRRSELVMARDRNQQKVIKELLETVIVDSGDLEETLKSCLEAVLSCEAISDAAMGAIFIKNEGDNSKMAVSVNMSSSIYSNVEKEYSKQMLSSIDEPIAPYSEAVNKGLLCQFLPLMSSNGSLGIMAICLSKDVVGDVSLGQFLSSVAGVIAGYVSRKQQEFAVIKSESLYRSIAETSSDGFWMVDMSGRLMEVNKAYIELSGYSEEELCQMSVLDLEALETPEQVGEHINKILEEGHDLFETEHLTKSGSRVPVEISVSYFSMMGGRFFVFIRDISERKRAEKSLAEYHDHLEELVANKTGELRSANNKLESIIESLPAAFYIKDKNDCYQMVNKEFARVVNMPREELIGRHSDEIFSEEYVESVRLADKSIFESKKSETTEEQLPCMDGSMRDFLTTRRPLLSDDGESVGLMGVMADISQQKSLQRDLSVAMGSLERRASLEHLVSEVTSSLIGVHPSFVGEEIEGVLAKVGAFTSADRCHFIEVDDQSDSLVLVHEWCDLGVPSVKENLAKVPASSQVFLLERLEFDVPVNISRAELSKDDEVLLSWLELVQAEHSLVLPVSYGGHLRGCLGIDSVTAKRGWTDGDVDLLKTQGVLLGQVLQSVDTQKELMSSKEEAERLARVKSDFLANMSHEIRTPLNGVLGLAQVGVRDNEDRRSQMNFLRILNSGKHLLGLVNDILDFSKLEAGRLHVENMTYELGEVVDRAVGFVSADAYKKGVQLLVHEAVDLPRMLAGDEMRITQVLGNLLGNALKFTEKGQVRLGVWREDNTLIFSVSDTGVGMNQEQMSRIFTPFEQADSSTTRRFGGTGLGLAISHYIVQALGGEISATSEPNVGTEFVVRLPIEGESGATVEDDFDCGHLNAVAMPEVVVDDLRKQLSMRSIELQVQESIFDLSDISGGCVVLPAELLVEADAHNEMLALAERGVNIVAMQVPGKEVILPKEVRDNLFFVDLPLRVRSMMDAVHGDKEAAFCSKNNQLRGMRVLAVEDTEINRMVLKDVLNSEGAIVTFAENGAEAVEVVEAEGGAFDVILMDVQMPVMDGYEATRLIKAIHPDLPIIGLTAHAFAEDKMKCLRAGMCDHVSKPLDVDILLAAIFRHLQTFRPIECYGEEGVESMDISVVQEVVEGGGLAGSSEGGLIAWDALNERFDHRSGFIARLLESALDGVGKYKDALHHAIEEQDMNELASAAHAIKGTVANVMAYSVSEMAAETERMAKNQDVDAFSTAQTLLGRLDDLMGELKSY